MNMNKSDFVSAIADDSGQAKADVEAMYNSMVNVVTGSLQDGKTISLLGFGTFSVKERAARTGRNPQTGEALQIKASKNPAFKAGKALKDAVN